MGEVRVKGNAIGIRPCFTGWQLVAEIATLIGVNSGTHMSSRQLGLLFYPLIDQDQKETAK